VVGENQRVLDAAEALAAADRERFGTLMYDSHASLRDLYQVSLPELDLLVELAHRQPGCYGARMTGAGLGGGVVCLVNASSVETFCLSMAAGYQRESGRQTQITTYKASEGVGRAGSS
jgi:galactokinase